MPNEVDKVIHPHPTGAAAALAQKHAAPASSGLTLYGGWFCPFVQRIWVALLELDIPHQYIEINPYHKEPHFLELNPRGLVPTLAIAANNTSTTQPNGDAQNGTSSNTSTNTNTTVTDHGIARADHSQRAQKVLYESVVVADYLNDLNSTGSSSQQHNQHKHDSSLYPADLYEKARCKLWIDHVGTRIVPAFYRLLQHTPDKAYSLESAREELRKHVYTWAKEVKGPWFLGEEFSMADVMLSPWAARLFLLGHYKGASGLPEAGVDEQGLEGEEKKEVWEKWWAWYHAILKRESVVATMSDRERYVQVYQRYAEDTTGSQAGQAIRSGRNLP